jgi:hypothetical protein
MLFMKKIIKNFFKVLASIISDKLVKKKETQQILLNQGKILSELISKKDAVRLSGYEWKVFSQWGEDGIIQFLISEVEILNNTFIEFGVEDFYESNCRFLLMNNDWQGFVIDCSEKNIDALKQTEYFWRYDLQAIAGFVDTDNINDLLSLSGFDKDLGILSIDIDGNDYHIVDAINSFSPRIIICEFNPYFGKDRAITVPYDPHFFRTKKHYSNLYFGASICAFEFLLEKNGYTLIGTGSMGSNAYFVKTDILTPKLHKLSQHKYNFHAHMRESRDENGKLNYLRGDEKYNIIKGMPVINCYSGSTEKL